MLSTLPEGQRTIMESTRVAAPRPKCRRGSLADSKLLLARTSALCFRLPGFDFDPGPESVAIGFLAHGPDAQPMSFAG